MRPFPFTSLKTVSPATSSFLIFPNIFENNSFNLVPKGTSLTPNVFD